MGNNEFTIPNDIVAVNYLGFMLVVSPSNGNWIVLENQKEVDAFKSLLDGESSEMVIKKFGKICYEHIEREIRKRRFGEKMEFIEEGFTLRIYLTHSCNLRCKHCFMYADNELENELTYEEIIDLLYKSKQAGCNKVILTGGEVTMKEHFLDIVKYAHVLGLYVQIMTNGVSWDQKMVDECAQYIDELQVSIDGFDEETNASIRGKGVFSRALQTVEMFSLYKNLLICIIITPLYDIFKNHFSGYQQFAIKMLEKYSQNNFLLIFSKELLDGRNVQSDYKKNERMRIMVNKLYESIYPNAELTTFVMNHEHNRIYKNCGYGGLTVNSNGDIHFCGRIMETRSYGNLRELPFDQIIRMRKRAREISSIEFIEPCNKCELKYICGGGCRVSQVPDLTMADLDSNKIYKRKCSTEYKNNFYKLMIESSEFLYW